MSQRASLSVMLLLGWSSDRTAGVDVKKRRRRSGTVVRHGCRLRNGTVRGTLCKIANWLTSFFSDGHLGTLSRIMRCDQCGPIHENKKNQPVCSMHCAIGVVQLPGAGQGPSTARGGVGKQDAPHGRCAGSIGRCRFRQIRCCQQAHGTGGPGERHKPERADHRGRAAPA